MAETVEHDERVAALLALREEVRAAWRPLAGTSVADRLRAVEADIEDLLILASVQAQRAQRDAEADAAARARTRWFFVHVGGHFGPCSDTRSATMTEAQLRPIAGSNVMHLDASQERPPWFPAPVLADAPVGG